MKADHRRQSGNQSPRLRLTSKAGKVKLGRCVFGDRAGYEGSAKFRIEILRMREIEAIIKHRHGDHIPDGRGTDDEDLCVAYIRAVATPGHLDNLASWCRRWAPWADPEIIQSIVDEARGRRRLMRSDGVAGLLVLSMRERTELGIKTIGACDMTAGKRRRVAADRKKERDRARQQERRQASGRKGRQSYEAESLSSLRPWEDEGISRSKWYRMQRETSVSRIDIDTNGDTPVSTAEKEPVPPSPAIADVPCAARRNPDPTGVPLAEVEEGVLIGVATANFNRRSTA